MIFSMNELHRNPIANFYFFNKDISKINTYLLIFVIKILVSSVQSSQKFPVRTNANSPEIYFCKQSL